MNCAYCTLVSTDNYTWGAICLSISKRRTAAKYPLVILVGDSVSDDNKQLLSDYGIVKVIPNHKFEHSYYDNYLCTKQKLEVFNLTEYDRVMFLDADVVMMDDFDYELEHNGILFDVRARYDDCKDIPKVCGEMFIITPSIDVFNILDTISTENNLQDDEQCLAYIYRPDFLVPLNKSGYSTFYDKAMHFCEIGEKMIDIDAPYFSNSGKYWEHYDMNDEVAIQLVNAIICRRR